MHEGRIHKIGTFKELEEERKGPFAELMRDYAVKQKDKEVGGKTKESMEHTKLSRKTKVLHF